jgi:hypothetical protein
MIMVVRGMWLCSFMDDSCHDDQDGDGDYDDRIWTVLDPFFSSVLLRPVFGPWLPPCRGFETV